MSIDRTYRIATIAVLALMAGAVILGLASLGGCAFLKSIGRTAAVAGGGAGGAILGTPAGPLGMAAGAAAGAGTVYAVQENSELREGTLQGDGARDEETKRLKSLLLIAQGDIQIKERALAEARGYLEESELFWLRVILAGFVTRNLMVFLELYRALRRKSWWMATKWFAHLFHPWRPKAPAPLPVGDGRAGGYLEDETRATVERIYERRKLDE